jgi:hypothetical protein
MITLNLQFFEDLVRIVGNSAHDLPNLTAGEDQNAARRLTCPA